MEHDVDAYPNPNERQISNVGGNLNLTANQTMIVGAATSAIIFAYRVAPFLVSLPRHVVTLFRFLFTIGLETFKFVANWVLSLPENVQSAKRGTAHFYHEITNRLSCMWKTDKMPSSDDSAVRESLPPMSEDRAEQILKDCKASWAKGRNIVVNQNTHTISVFDMDERGHDIASEDIPLTYQNVSVIPHPFPKLVPSVCPVELNMPTEELPDRLTNDQIRRLRDYLPDMESLDYFLDRQIIVTFAKSSYQLAVQKVGCVYFQAWSCTVLMILSPQLAGMNEYGHLMESVSSCIPGSNIFNVDNCFSSLGVFLKPVPLIEQKEIEIDLFTVSAHSFLSKKPLEFGFQKTSIILIAFLTILASGFVNSGTLPFVLVQQYLFVRIAISGMDVIWKTFGSYLGLHSVSGKVKIEKNISNLGLACIYILPILARFVISGIVEATYVGLSQCFSDLAWLQEMLPEEYLSILNSVVIFTSTYGPMLIEMRFTWLLLRYIRMFVEGFTPAGSTQVQRSDMVSGWMNVIVRNSTGMCGSVKFPYFLCFLWPLLCRYLTNYGYLEMEEEGIRFAGLLIFMWDVVLFVWGLDIPWTYNLVDQPVLTASRGVIGRIIASLEPSPSVTSPQVLTNDLAIGKFTSGVTIPSYRPIEWDNGSISADTRLYLLGRKTTGHYNSWDTKEVVQGPVRGIVGGWRYIMNLVSHTRSADYETALIWRCNNITIVGDSGSLLIRMQDQGDGQYMVHGVGFQSHELPISIIPMGTKPQSHWKIAFRPPLKLIAEYRALTPSDTIDVLEKDARERGKTSDPVARTEIRETSDEILDEILDDFIRRDRGEEVV